MLAFHLATFKVDATPPPATPLCGGWIKPVVGVDDPLWLRGVVLHGGGRPIVLAALDWTGVMDESHRLWTEALAEAAHTTPDRVALHCVHQHNAPFIDREGNALLRKAGRDPLLYDEEFVDRPGQALGRRRPRVAHARAAGHPHPHRAGRGQAGRLQPPRPRPERQDQVHPLQRHEGPRRPRRARGHDRPDAQIGRLLSGRSSRSPASTITRRTR